jgi:hypothetical protein
MDRHTVRHPIFSTCFALQLHFTVTTAPSHGTLLLNGSATSSFTQADISNGVVSHHEAANFLTSDSFLFTVTDAAGNNCD